MILNTKEFKEACQTILMAIDTKNVTLYNETLELDAHGSILELNVTNRQYFVTVKFPLTGEENFKAAVKAKTFLSLISKITTSTVELVINGQVLEINANGNYKMPLIFNNNSMLELPKIDLGVVTNNFDINSDILLSILTNNGKELLRGADLLNSNMAKPAQENYYIDELGAITFTSGACVNSFTLPNPVKILLDDKSVKLFKLFKGDTQVHFEMSQVSLNENLTQTVLRFQTDKVILTTIMPDSSIISSVPTTAIRGMANKNYPYSFVLDKESLLQSLNRISIFGSNDSKMYINLVATNNSLVIKDLNGAVSENIIPTNTALVANKYSFNLDLKNLKLILDGNTDQYVTMCFGDGKAVVFKKTDITDIIPEVRTI